MKTVLFVISLFIASIAAFAQTDNISDEKRLKFGFGVGVNHSLILDDGLPANASVVNNPGMRLGIFAEYEALNYLFIAPRAELSFNNGEIDFLNQDGSNTLYDVMPVSLEFMAHFIFKKEGDWLSPYILVGPNVKLPLSEKSNETDEFGTATDFAIDFGIGVDKAFTHFNFAPELRYSYGLLNVNENPAIQSLGFHSISLVFNFKG